MESGDEKIAEEERDIQTEVRNIIQQLDVMDRTYFNKDRPKQIKLKIEEGIALLDTKPLDLVKNKKEKSDLLFLRGKTMDFLPEYSKMAEENLSKSIKLLPTKVEAYDALGHVYWKKKDVI